MIFSNFKKGRKCNVSKRKKVPGPSPHARGVGGLRKTISGRGLACPHCTCFFREQLNCAGDGEHVHVYVQGWQSRQSCNMQAAGRVRSLFLLLCAFTSFFYGSLGTCSSLFFLSLHQPKSAVLTSLLSCTNPNHPNNRTTSRYADWCTSALPSISPSMQISNSH